MEVIEYRNVVDKAGWERGPWDSEVDKKQWKDEETGLPCLILRGPHGALCGYVGVPAGHPWHGQGYDDCGAYEPKPEEYDDAWYPKSHGGLTYAAGCSHGANEARGICHIPGKGEADDVWWLGFDCAHSGDRCDMAYPAHIREKYPHRGDIYRDQAYVERECLRLAKQAAALA